MKYLIEVEETLTKTVSIEAQDIDEAQNIAEKQYKDGIIVLSADDFSGIVRFNKIKQ